MNTRIDSRQRNAATGKRTSARTARRAAFRAGAAQRAAAQRRKKNITAWSLRVGGVVVAVGLIIGGVFAFRSSDSGTSKAATSASASATAGAAASGNPALSTKPTVTAGTGALTALAVTPLIQGTGPVVAKGQTISVNYVGVSFTTGKEFDSSWTRSQPFSFTVGQGKVIPGWDQGLVGVAVGSRVQLDIPSALAYGDTAAGGAPSGPLRFVVDVLSAS